MSNKLIENGFSTSCSNADEIGNSNGKPWLGSTPEEKKSGYGLLKKLFPGIPEKIETEEWVYSGSVQNGKREGYGSIE